MCFGIIKTARRTHPAGGFVLVIVVPLHSKICVVLYDLVRFWRLEKNEIFYWSNYTYSCFVLLHYLRW